MREMAIITFDEVGNGKPPDVWMAVTAYLNEYGGKNAVTLAENVKRVWAVIERGETGIRVFGVTGLWQIWDIPFFHCDDERARVELIRRMRIVHEEAGLRFAFVFVDPKAFEHWEPLLKALKAEPSNRWRLPVRNGGA